MKPNCTVPLAIAAALLMAMMMPAQSQFVADASYAVIPPQDLPVILKTVAGKFERPDSVVFAELRTVEQGYCGFVNATLEQKGFVPFFLETASHRVELGSEGELTMVRAARQLQKCP